MSAAPRLLVLDSTRVNAPSATGQLKGDLLRGWPADRFRQIYLANDPIAAPGAPASRLVLARTPEWPARDEDLAGDAEALEAIFDFCPSVIYYRPTIDQHPGLHELALAAIERFGVPVVSQIMDDWPTRLAARDPEAGAEADRQLRELFAGSAAALSISEKMSAVLGERYGTEFEPIANGVDVEAWRQASAAAERRRGRRKGLVLRYSGGIARDMNFDTVVAVARAVDALQDELDVTLEVYTWDPWRLPFEIAIAGLRGTTIGDRVDREDYAALLAEADALVLAYNFDPASVAYIGLSMPNKLPECLASGAALLAVGPLEANGISYLVDNGLGEVVTEPDEEKIAAAIRALADPVHREDLAVEAQRWAFERFDLEGIADRFGEILATAAASGPPAPLLGPFPASERATVDEADALRRLGAPGTSATQTQFDASRYAELTEAALAAGKTVYVSEWHPLPEADAEAEPGVGRWRRLRAEPGPLDSLRARGTVLAFDPDPGPEAVRGAFAASLTTDPEVYTGAAMGPGGSLREAGGNPVVIAGRLVMWTGRKTAAHPLPAALVLLVLTGLVVLGIAGSGAASAVGWIAAGALAAIAALVIVAGFANFLVMELRAQFRRQQHELWERLNAERSSVRHLRAHATANKERTDAVIARMGALSGEIQAAAKEARGGDAALERHLAALERRLAALERRLGAAELELSREVSLDLVSVMRHLRPLLIDGGISPDEQLSAADQEHGHGLLMALLVSDARRAPGSLAGKTLIEVGTTREHDPWQGSTEKLAILTALTGVDFVTVDVDPENTVGAERVLAYLNPAAQAVTMKGEDYLAGDPPPLDYVYLDAFDFDHGKHSEQRQQRYRELLDTEITDPEAWRMHELCAEALVARMPVGGAVVIDDTWTDEAGELAGKGKTAIPLLEAGGFEVVARTRMTIALRRTSSGSGPDPR